MAPLLAVGFLPGMPVLVALLGHIPIGMSLLAIAWIMIGRHLLASTRSQDPEVVALEPAATRERTPEPLA